MLEKSGRLNGIIDERGKYIYISPESFQKVAAFVKQRGRVSLSEIARESNRLIDLSVPVATTDDQVDEKADQDWSSDEETPSEKLVK